MSVNFFSRVSVSGAAFSSTPDCNLAGNSSFSLINEGTGTIEYSFDGTTLHGDLIPSTASSALAFNNRGYNLIWFRLKSGATSNIRVEAAQGSIEVDGISANATAPLPANAAQETGGNLATIATNTGRISAAATLADATTNPSTTSVGAFNQVFNGTTWDRVRSGLVAVQTTFVGIQNALSMGRYNATPPTLADGNAVVNQLDINGNLKDVEQYAPTYEDNTNGVALMLAKAIATNSGAWTLTSSASSGVGTSGVSIKGSAGRIRGVRVSNANATTGFWLQIFNKASAAVNNDVPVDRIYVPSQTISGMGVGGTQFIDFGSEGLYLGTGISIAASSTVGLLTLIGATDMHYSCRWI